MRGDEVGQSKLVAYLQEAQAMEQAVLMMLNSMVLSTRDPLLLDELRRHRRETVEHERRLSERLRQLGAGASRRRQLLALGPSLVKGVVDQVRPDKPSHNLRDGFATEHFEIATYEILERLAKLAGDERTAATARANRADEERMAAELARSWDRGVELTLGRPAPVRPSRRTTPRRTRRRTATPAPTDSGS